MRPRAAKKRGISSRKYERSKFSLHSSVPLFSNGLQQSDLAKVMLVALLLLTYCLLPTGRHGRRRRIHDFAGRHRVTFKPVDRNSLPPSLRIPKVIASDVLHPMNDNMAFQRDGYGINSVGENDVGQRYRDLVHGYLAPFRQGIRRIDYMKVMKRRSYKIAPPGANRGLQSVLFQVVEKRLYMVDPHGVGANHKQFYRSRLVEVIWLLGKLVRAGRIPNTEFVLSIHDCVQTVRYKNPYRTARYLESSPSFTLIACNFSDNIPLPVWEGEAQRGGHLRGWDEQMDRYGQDEIDWKDKISKAVFRGGNRQSMYFRRQEEAHKHCREVGRSKLLYIAQERPELFNVSLSGMCGGERYTLERLSPREHHMFKYVIYIEGNCMWADRLKTLVFGPSAIIKQETACGQFFEPLLKRFVHYLPTEYFLNDVEDVVTWARENEQEVRSIVQKANEFATTFLTLSAIETYVVTALSEYTKLLLNQTIDVRKGAVDVTEADD